MKGKSAVKAYKNLDFLQSHDARIIRVLCELIEPQTRFRKYDIENTIVFFGSARIKPNVNYMSRYYDDARSLSYKLTRWAKHTTKGKSKLLVCTGGGTGIMEAVSRGASEAGGKSIGFNISLPFKQELNDFIPQDLAFEFHYFFIRKFWFAYMAKALIVFPGGFGTLDELTEILTLVQTGKVQKKLPIVLFGTDYWKKVLNFDEMIKFGTINKDELKLFNFFDDVDETFEFLKKELVKFI